ncbi:MAG: squalene--hopene cyclase, partial [Syntrophobacteraceae bacterium]
MFHGPHCCPALDKEDSSEVSPLSGPLFSTQALTAHSTSPFDECIEAGTEWLLENREPGGFWAGRLQSNSCMEAEWLLAMHFLGIGNSVRHEKVIRSILNEQREDGSWDVYHGAVRGDINTTVECYAALRACGLEKDSEAPRKAREWIFANGGLTGIRNFTKYWLALIGEWPWEQTPALPPELMLFPSWVPFNIYRFASWARGTMVPLSILSARRPARPLPEGRRLDELFPGGRSRFDYRLPLRQGWAPWEKCFYLLDRMLHLYTGIGLAPSRETAIRVCIEWIIRRQEPDGTWCGIQPPWIYSLLALHAEGYGLDHPVMRSGLAAFDSHWFCEHDGGSYLQASESPIWDTILSMRALLDCGFDTRACPSLKQALEWLIEKQIHTRGDWAVRVPNAEGGGWAFQHYNGYYPDVDDTAVIVAVLAKVRASAPETAGIGRAIERAVEWMLSMQCSNGGWAAFDKDNDAKLVTKIPFCDFGELLDPPSVDVTAHVVEALALVGYDAGHPVMAKALAYIRDEQEPDGSWFGRWGVNHIYGTSSVLPALQAVGEDMKKPYALRAADWLVSRQNPDGGWGESPASYVDVSFRGVGPSTASQTAWAIMALLALGTRDFDFSIRRGVDFLVGAQK